MFVYCLLLFWRKSCSPRWSWAKFVPTTWFLCCNVLLRLFCFTYLGPIVTDNGYGHFPVPETRVCGFCFCNSRKKRFAVACCWESKSQGRPTPAGFSVVPGKIPGFITQRKRCLPGRKENPTGSQASKDWTFNCSTISALLIVPDLTKIKKKTH